MCSQQKTRKDVEQSTYGLIYVRLYYPSNVPKNEEIHDKIQYSWCPGQNSIHDQRYKQKGRLSVQRPLNECRKADER